jgi:glycosyltransferase involved in cell wall biosynthesis
MPMSKQLSICITNFKRSKVDVGDGKIATLLPDCIASLAQVVRPEDDAELIISNYDDSDWPLRDWVDKKVGEIPYTIIQGTGNFHNGAGRNLAADHATGKYILFVDADMVCTRSIIENGLEAVKAGKLYYPICFYFLNAQHSLGFWCDGAKGIVMMPKAVYEEVGKWPCPPSYEKNNNVDQHFYQRVKRLGFAEVNNREANYFHQFHPGLSVDVIFRRKRRLIKNANSIVGGVIG